MSQTPPFSHPPEPLPAPSWHAASAAPGRAGSEGALGKLEEAIRRLRAELAEATDRTRQGRLLSEIADIEERTGDEPAAARDYLGAYNADGAFREPLEGLVRLLEKRHSVKNLGKLLDALVRAAAQPDERVRALLMRAYYQADIALDVHEAVRALREATQVEGASAAERASAWLSLEVHAGRVGDVEARREAFEQRAQCASQTEWRALLLLDQARMATASGEVDAALALLAQARSLASPATWTITVELEHLLRDHPGAAGSEAASARADLHANTLEALASLMMNALGDPAAADALGVPQWARTPARALDAQLCAAEARRALGQLESAATMLDRVEHAAQVTQGEGGSPESLAHAVVADARIRIAEQAGDSELASQLADQRLTTEVDGARGATLAMRVAEHTASRGDTERALEALARAIADDPGCLPARALQLDLLADSADPGAFPAQIESFAQQLTSDEGRGRAFLLAAYLWSTRARDNASAKAALSQAAKCRIAPSTRGRLARTLASIAGDVPWYEEATEQLLANDGEDEWSSLQVELVRLQTARGDAEGATKTLSEMAATPAGAWLARALEAFPTTLQREGAAAGEAATRGRQAIEGLAALEPDPALSRGLLLLAATRALAADDMEGARNGLRSLVDSDPSDPLVASLLADLDRAAGDHSAAGRTAAGAAAATADPQLAAAWHVEAAFEQWRHGDRNGALASLESAAANAPDAARLVLGWAARGVDFDSLEGRRRAIEYALKAGGDGRVLSLERFATEAGGGDPEQAASALAAVETISSGDIGLAGALARLAWPGGATDHQAVQAAMARVAARGPRALAMVEAERLRAARERRNPEEAARAASRWFDAGGGLPAAIEWLAAATALRQPGEEQHARLAAAQELQGDAREAMIAGAALLQASLRAGPPPPMVTGQSAAVRLANLELGPSGCDPRRRGAALSELDCALGEEARVDAASLSGWSSLAASQFDAARTAFEMAAASRPGDLGAWEGLRALAEASGDKALGARAAAELGARCADAGRGASFWEEAALLWLQLGEDAAGEDALEASFTRDPTRRTSFDLLFRRVRERKDNDKLLSLIERRIEYTDEPAEILKLFWEQARALREKGDQEGALLALDHVTMLDADHVGALALLGEINIRRGHYEAAAQALARLASLASAPPKSRVTAGIAAVDLYENKLAQFDQGLEVLRVLHAAGLSTLPVRERLARAAARSGAWKDATGALEVLMHERPDPEGRVEAARLAMAIHRDRLGQPQGAAGAVVKLLEEAPSDSEALDLLLRTEHPAGLRGRLLERARTSLVEHLQARPAEATTVRRLADVARALSNDGLQQAALGVLLALDPDPAIGVTFAKLASGNAQAPGTTLSDGMFQAVLAPGDEGPVGQLFALLGPTLASALGPTLQTCGVGRRDRVDLSSGLALRSEVAAWAGAFGVHDLDVYIGGKDPLGVQAIPGEPPVLVIGAGVRSPLSPLTRAHVARELLGMARGTNVTRTRDGVTIAAIVVAACRLADVPLSHPPNPVLAEVERLIVKAIPRKTRKRLPPVCGALASSGADVHAWIPRAIASQDRAAVLASGDACIVLCELLGVTIENLGTVVKDNPRAEELLRFQLSPQYLELRQALGLEGA